MIGPLDRSDDPTTTPTMTDDALNEVWDWLSIMSSSPGQNPDWPLLLGVADLLREIDRARAEITRLSSHLDEVCKQRGRYRHERNAARDQLAAKEA